MSSTEIRGKHIITKRIGRLNRMTIKQKLIISFTTILIILAGVGIFSINALKEVNEHSTTIASEIIPQINLANTINFEIARFRSFEFQHMTLTDTQAMDDLEVRMTDMNTSIIAHIQEFQSMENNTEIETISSNWDAYLLEDEKLVEESRKLNKAEALVLIKATSKEKYDIIAEAALALVAVEVEESNAASTAGNVTYQKISSAIIILIIVAVLLGASMALFIIISITKPLGHLKKLLGELASKGGDLTQTIEIKSKDEIAELATAVNQFIQNIRTIIQEVNLRADGVEEAYHPRTGRVRYHPGTRKDSPIQGSNGGSPVLLNILLSLPGKGHRPGQANACIS